MTESGFGGKQSVKGRPCTEVHCNL